MFSLLVTRVTKLSVDCSHDALVCELTVPSPPRRDFQLTKEMVMEKPSAQLVGREFVRQYYTLLNQAPDYLHRYAHHVTTGQSLL